MSLWHCRCTLEGLNLEKLIRLAADHGIILREMKRLSPNRIRVQLDAQAVPALIRIADQWGWKHSELTPIGRLALLHLLRQRWLLALMLILSAVSVWLMSQWIWVIEVHDAGACQQDIEAFMAQQGIRLPVHRSAVDLPALRDALEWRYPEAAWFECALRGSILEVRMMDGVTADKDESDGVCDVIAVQDGIVTQIITCAGTPVVKVGDTVRRGDLLIRGEERTSDEKTRRVAARGKVIANVWEFASVRTRLRVTETNYTGREMEDVLLRLPWFQLWKGAETAFVHEDVSVREQQLSSLFIPVRVRYETHMEAELTQGVIDLEQAKDEGYAAARRILLNLAPPDASFIDIWPNWSIIDDEILLSEAIGHRQVDIAVQTRSSGMAAPE